MFELPHIPYIHIWRNVERGAARERIHYHNLDLTSLLVAGRLTDVRYDISDEKPHTHALYDVEFGDFGSRRVRDTRTCSISTRSRQEYRAGDVYDIPALNFHNTEIDPDDWPVTFVVTSKQLDRPDVALGRMDGPAIEYFHHDNDLDSDALDVEMASAVARLSRAHDNVDGSQVRT